MRSHLLYRLLKQSFAYHAIFVHVEGLQPTSQLPIILSARIAQSNGWPGVMTNPEGTCQVPAILQFLHLS